MRGCRQAHHWDSWEHNKVMERVARLLSMPSTFSALSLADGSEVISEVEEIHEVSADNLLCDW